DRMLKLEFATFRDKIRPGTRETWRVTVKSPSGQPVEAGAAELLGYMYDRSLDVFAPHQPPSVLALYPSRIGTPWTRATLGAAQAQWVIGSFNPTPSAPSLQPDRLKELDRYGIGGPGARGRRQFQMRGGVGAGVVAESMALDAAAPPPAPASAPARQMAKMAGNLERDERKDKKEDAGGVAPAAAEPPALRSNFAETAFWTPQLLTGADGSASIEFTVPDSVTSWNVWLHAVTKDLRGGSLKKETKSVKELMVRPYVPRFLREGDRAELKVVVNNASEGELKGSLAFQILDPETNEDLSARFGLSANDTTRTIVVPKGGGTNHTFFLTAPPGVRTVAFKVTATSGSLSDGELRPLPVLPSRMHLVQSRFVTLREGQRKELRFEDLAKGGDPTLINEQMVVTVDAQLFYSVLEALPYLVNYPYECTEQTLNRFVSTGIVSSIFEKYPSVAAMAKEFSKRDVRLETWDAADPNRKMTLEESPWLVDARGGKDAGERLAKVLDPRVAKAEREAAIAKLRKAQTSIGGFPWWPGGPPSPYMTIYILHGLAKASEFGVEVPRDMIERGWSYVAKHYREDLRSMMAKDCCWETLTFINYVASCYPDPSWMGNALTAAERKEILAFS
ncbi:MAG TPA: alpha-2-macroglobulin family protein, partial [Thermoanaerobaculia bacterium]|nr:alpha-2-macroglobulin family protein [Thermoanaerobaculia bacterium]